MIKISKQNNSLIVEGIENAFYINNGDNSYPLNSLIVVTDNSDMATFRSVATNDVLFSGLINNITINGEVVTKDNIIQKFDAVSNSSTGGAVDAYTKEEADNKFASKDELTNVQTVANDADTKVDALTPRVESVETAMDGKQATLVSGENIKTINSESILGTGDIQINAGAKLVQMGTPAPFNGLDILLRNAVSALNNGTDYTDTFMSMNETICKQYFDLFKTLKNGDLLSTYDVIAGNIFRVECNPLSFKHSKGNNAFDIIIKYLGDFSAGSPKFINYTRDIYVHYYFYKYSSGEIGQVDLKVYTKKAGPTLQKNDFKTINGESVIGEGNLEVSGVSEEQAQEIAKIPTLETELAQKANVSDVPTVQTDSLGTNKNYIYSDVRSTYAGVISNIELNHLAEKVNIRIYKWTTDASKPSYSTEFLSKATTTSAGVMSAADKTKLDSISNEWTGTQSEYDALTTKEDNIIYYVTE